MSNLKQETRQADRILLYFVDTAVFTKWKVCGNAVLIKSIIGATFPTAFKKIKVCILFFRHKAIAHLIDYSIT